MRDYIIMTDSCCSLNQQEVDELGITVLPLSFTMEGKTYLDTPDHADMSPETFFQKIADGVDCTTAAVNVGQFTDAMTEVLNAGKDILCICFSSALSTTYQSACIAADDLRGEHPEAKIIVIDSLSACRGQGMLIYRTVRERREKDLDIDALAEFVRGTIQHQDHWFIVDDLNHLKRGGRVSAAAALVGTVLGIKPVLHTGEEPARVHLPRQLPRLCRVRQGAAQGALQRHRRARGLHRPRHRRAYRLRHAGPVLCRD